MESFQLFIDLRFPDHGPELFALALVIRHIHGLIDYGGSDIGRAMTRCWTHIIWKHSSLVLWKLLGKTTVLLINGDACSKCFHK